MRNQMLKWIGIVAMAMGGLLFTQCEDGFIETQTADELTLSMRDDNGEGTVLETGDFESLAEFCTCLLEDLGIQELSEGEELALQFMREEEKMARDIYKKLYENWEMPIFNNIATAEQRHMDAVFCLIDRYELTDPVGEQGPGVFTSGDIQALYDAFLAAEPATLVAALTEGAKIEDRDIADLMAHLANDAIDNEDIKKVFGALLKASHNHLRAFTTLLANVGVTYEPLFLDEEVYADILATNWERGGLTCLTCPVCDGECDGECPVCDGVCPVCDGICDGVCPNSNGDCPRGDGICDGTCPGCDGVCPGNCVKDNCPQFKHGCCIGKCGQVVGPCNRFMARYRNQKGQPNGNAYGLTKQNNNRNGKGK